MAIKHTQTTTNTIPEVKAAKALPVIRKNVSLSVVSLLLAPAIVGGLLVPVGKLH